MNSFPNREHLKNLQNQLEHGDLARIARLAGCNPVTVKRFFRGSTSRFNILECAIQILEYKKDIAVKLARFTADPSS